MCGIAGKLNLDPAQPVDEALLRRMCRALRHRGPDDEGVAVLGGIGLGHRRLSIIDLSPAGHQPMRNDDGTVWLVFNGEIYNFSELRVELEASGARFRSRTDTEVILRLYEREGVECIHRLRGMFAFAIWDARRRTLVLARDRLGVKPLFYRLSADSLIFASELKAILEDPDVAREVDPVAIHHYLTYQCVPAPFCAFKGISKLPPAHVLTWRDGRVDLQRYWKLSYLPKHAAATAREERDLEEELRRRFEEAVRIRMVSDVPLGAFLSGGVDSSAVVAMMSRLSDRPVRTFSIGFDEQAYDELPAARQVANRFQTDHTEFRVRLNAMEVLPSLVWHFDEPYADASCIPTYHVSQLAREHVTVVLNGDAGDENFAGYDRYVANELAHRYRALAPVLSNGLSRALLDRLPNGHDAMSVPWRMKRFAEQLAKSPQQRNVGWLSQFDNVQKRELYSEGFLASVRDVDSERLVLDRYGEAEAEDFVDRTLYADVMTYLPDALLVKVDIASMANGLEARSPFLDHELMEFVARIPPRLKLKGTRTKIILRRAMRDVLPREILARGKMGFNVPLDTWLRHGLRELAHDLLLSRGSLERGYFRPAFVRRMLEQHASGRRNWHSQIWNLMMLELWHRTFIDAGKARCGPITEMAADRQRTADRRSSTKAGGVVTASARASMA